MKGAEEIFIDKKADVGILMLHGFSSCPRQFKELSEYLSERNFNILAPLIAGHGTTEEDFMKSSPAEWTSSVLNAYLKLRNISKKVFIIGNSFGSNLGMWLVKELENEPVGIVTLGAPIFLRWHRMIKFRLSTYGKLRKYYHKPRWLYQADYTDMVDEISYPSLPVKSINEFMRFIETETKSDIKRVRIPILIASAVIDMVVHPKSVEYIFNNVSSQKKEIFWFHKARHDMLDGESTALFQRIYAFIREVIGTT